MTATTHNLSTDPARANCLRENRPSSSYGEGLETDRDDIRYRASPLPDKISPPVLVNGNSMQARSDLNA